MTGKTLGHYRVLEKIGQGGMGLVYRARDERLARDVALKVLPAGTLADETARKRFRKEALTLSQLNHPNIAIVHDFDTHDGVDFLVMEYVGGDTLAAKLATGPLPEKETVALGTQIAEALEEAHESGVVHRDLKPGNVMVTTKGRVKVLDFGLAKLVRPVGNDAVTAMSLAGTQVGAVAGTVPYMAPEQLRGEAEDVRTDVYALGGVIYEMATGRRPFSETHAPQLITAILSQEPPPPSKVNAMVSAGLEAIILKALAKDPARRYQSAKELLEDLGRLSAPGSVVAAQRLPMTRGWVLAAAAASLVAALAILLGLNVGRLRERLLGAGPPRIESLAVLPLENLSRDPEQEYFADGMTEALIADLGQISSLRVISRTSVMQYKGARKPLPQIAKELNVDGVVEGSVLREGDRVRITAQLIYAATDRHLWAHSYERHLRDVLSLQDEVAQAIASEIKIKLTPQEELHLASARQVNPQAHEDYLKGRYWWNKRTEEGLNKGIEYFQLAIANDPNYALAYGGLADCHSLLAYYGFVDPKDGYPKAREAALRALEIDDSLAETHASLAFIKTHYDWDWPATVIESHRAIELNPSYATAHQWFANALDYTGRLDEAIAEDKRALELDPLSLVVNWDLGTAFYYARQYDQAIEQEQKTLELDPKYIPAHSWLGMAYVQESLYEEAISEFENALKIAPDTGYVLAGLGYAYAVADRKTESRKVLDQLNELSMRKYVPATYRALVYVGLREKDKAFKWLEKSYEDRSIGNAFGGTIKVDPIFDPLRSDPRFQDLLRRMNLPP